MHPLTAAILRPTLLRAAAAFALLLSATPSYAAPENYSSRTLPAKRAAQPPVIDGSIDDTIWKEAPLATPFIDTITEKPAADSTQSWLLYDDQALYVAFHCHDAEPSRIVAREIRYGAGLGDDDTVNFSIDPYYTRTFGGSSSFVVNAIGTQNESIAGGRAAKREWRGVWQAAAQRTADGWTAEMRIPWSMLNYPNASAPVTMGLNFSRYQSRSHVESVWSNLTQTYHPEYIGRWTGVLPPRGSRIKPVQEMVYLSPEWTEDGRAELHAGADLRYRPNPQMTGVLSISPDFRNVERAVEGIQFSRSERYVGETRPFFVEGRRFFPSLFYSPRIRTFDVGAKAFGKINPALSFGLLSVQRSLDYNASVGKIGYSLAQHGEINLVGTMRRSHDPQHEGYGGNASLVSNAWSLDADFVRAREGSASGSSVGLGLGYNLKNFNVAANYGFTDPEYSPSLGFFTFTDQRYYALSTGYNPTYRTGPLRNLGLGVSLYHYTHMNGDFFQNGASLYGSITTRNDYALSVGRSVGRFENAHDRTFNVNLAGNVSNRYTSWSLSHQGGLLDDHPVSSWTLGARRRLFRKMDVGVAGSILRHEQNREQYIVTVGWEFDARRAVNGRLVQEDGHLNWYAAFRNAGGLGQDLFLIIGDPNAKRFTTRVALKWVWAN